MVDSDASNDAVGRASVASYNQGEHEQIETMAIQLTHDQWIALQQSSEQPIHFVDPAQQLRFVLVRAEVYERFKSLFEADAATQQERLFHLQQFGRRAGWDDPTMDIYNDLDPRRAP